MTTDETKRPWFDFDGKIVLAALFVLGYYGLVYRISGDKPIPPANAQLVRDALLVLGPPLGAIFNAIYRTTGAEERQSERRSDEIKTAITTPTITAAPDPAPRDAREAADQVAGAAADEADQIAGDTK